MRDSNDPSPLDIDGTPIKVGDMLEVVEAAEIGYLRIGVRTRCTFIPPFPNEVGTDLSPFCFSTSRFRVVPKAATGEATLAFTTLDTHAGISLCGCPLCREERLAEHYTAETEYRQAEDRRTATTGHLQAADRDPALRRARAMKTLLDGIRKQLDQLERLA